MIPRTVWLSPFFTSLPLPIAIQDQPYAYEAAALDLDGDPLTFTLIQGPDGMTVDAQTGAVTWTPAAADVDSDPLISLRVEDDKGGVDTQTYRLYVRATNRAPQFVSAPGLIAHVEAAYTYDAEAEDDAFDRLTYALADGPDGMTIDPGDGTLTWTPDDTDFGAHSVTVTVTDLLGATDVVDQAAIDPYGFTRDAYFQYRRNLVYDGNPPPDENEFNEFNLDSEQDADLQLQLKLEDERAQKKQAAPAAPEPVKPDSP